MSEHTASWRQPARWLGWWRSDVSLRLALSYGLGAKLGLLLLLGLCTGLFPVSTERKPSIEKGLMMWDGNAFVLNAEEGYSLDPADGHVRNSALFPLYPLLGRYVAKVVGSTSLALLLIANLASLGFLYYLHRLVRLDFGEAVAERALLLVLLYPVSFIYTCAYSESLSLLLGVASLYYMRTNRWGLAWVLAGAAGMTRVNALVFGLAVLVEWLAQRRWRERDWGYMAISALLAAAYPLYLGWSFGKPLAFVTVQERWGHVQAWPWGSFWRSLVYAWEQSPRTYNFALNLFNLLMFVLAVGSLVAIWRRLRPSYAVLTAALVFVATMLSSPSGIPMFAFLRYVMLAVPLFVMLAVWSERPWVRALLIWWWAPLLGIFASMFFCGFWIC